MHRKMWKTISEIYTSLLFFFSYLLSRTWVQQLSLVAMDYNLDSATGAVASSRRVFS